jgi:UDP:flavonoid glycosyltransferase YjiC (YdhE family)
MVKKPSLADMAAKKPAPVVPLPAEVPAPAAAEPAAVDRRKAVMVRIAPEGWRELRDLAASLTIETGKPVTMQSLILDQINGLLREHGRPQVA